MDTDDIITILCEKRLDGEINKRVLKDPDYKEAERDSAKKIEKLLKAGLTKKQRRRLDQFDSSKNNLALEYGRIAYFQGMKDGFQLSQILSGNQETKTEL
ncbi:hypothetical protein QMP26_05255 [Enterocloster clostridioformis]|uniref:hypothetical protein n=1 Tax=Enterocloster clostridioformis TaxID=1531 RepID=UPI0026760E27|nr:hypothetical protein [Enterocloster clostridioformis]